MKIEQVSIIFVTVTKLGNLGEDSYALVVHKCIVLVFYIIWDSGWSLRFSGGAFLGPGIETYFNLYPK